MRTRLLRLPLIALALLPVSARTLGAAEGGGAAADRRFSGTVDVEVINVDVVVTDRKGNPIRDLQRDDFEIRADDKTVEITNFYAVQASGEAVPGAPSSPGSPTAEPMQWVLLFDNANTRVQNRQHLLGQLRQTLRERLGPRDRVMIASYDRGITVHNGLTSDPATIATGLQALEGTVARGQENESDLDMLRKVIGYNMSGDRCDLIGEEAISRYTNSVSHRVRSALTAIGELVGSLGGVPGRKSLLYFSDGLEIRPGESILQARNCDEAGSMRANGYDLAMALKKLTSIANTARVTFYPVDAAGGRSGQDSQADGATDFVKRTGLTDSLVFLAADTGGKALLNALDLPTVVNAVAKDAASFYSLGFSAPSRGRGELRSIDVRVKRRGAELRYRHGYQDKSPTERMLDRLLAALWLGEADNPLAVQLEPGGSSLAVAAGYQVPMRIGVPLDRLELRPAGDHREGKLMVFVTALGEDGSLGTIASDQVPVSVREESWAGSRGKLFGYEIQLVMKPGKQRVAIGVRDELAGLTSLVVHDVEVGPHVP